jgi:hypothetical protein
VGLIISQVCYRARIRREGKRGSERDGKEDGERGSTGGRDEREDSVALYPAGKAFPRTEKHIRVGEERNREGGEEMKS